MPILTVVTSDLTLLVSVRMPMVAVAAVEVDSVVDAEVAVASVEDAEVVAVVDLMAAEEVVAEVSVEVGNK